VGAATPIALPPLPDFGSPSDAVHGRTQTQRAWPPIEQHAIPAPPTPEPAASVAPERGWATTYLPETPETDLPDRRTARPSHAAVVESPPVADEEHHPFNRGLVWGLRSAILGVVVFTGLYFGRDSLPANVDFRLPGALEQRFGLVDERETPDVSQIPAGGQDMGSGSIPETAVATGADSDGTNGAPNSTQIGQPEDDQTGVGGQDGEITPVDPGIGEYADPTSEPEPDQPADQSGGEANLPADDGSGDTGEPVEDEVVATDPPVDGGEPTVAPAEPTSPPATEAPVTDTPATEAPVTESPATDVPATETPVPGEPTEVPGRQDPTVTAEATVDAVPTEEQPTTASVTEEPVAMLESQPASVDAGSTPEQALASGEFRYSITGASRGETVPEIPDLNAVGTYGEWVVLSMYGQNWSDTEQVFDMSEFRLYADGEEVLLDVGNAWVSGLLGHTPAYGNTDAILWAADEGHPFALTFLAPPDARQLTLVAGDQSIDLSAALANPAPLAQDDNATLPEYLDAEVVDVLSAEEIVIEIDGIEQTVRYLGLDVPTGDDCFAADATEANRALVEGKTVRLERQATDVDARGRWVRDVWAPAEDGRYFLVSEALVAEGAATVGISEPNTRYEGWLMGSQSVAKAEGRGLWGTCDGETADAPLQQAAVAPVPGRATYRRRAR
jgi:endonuclease YncB( thermonuclease family)